MPEALEEFERLASLRRESDTERPTPPRSGESRARVSSTARQAASSRHCLPTANSRRSEPDRPPFKVMGEPTLVELARRAPRQPGELHGIPGMSPDQIQRYGAGILQAVEHGLRAQTPPPPRMDREPDDVRDRYDHLHTWRKERARKRGVESDVILPRTALWDSGAPPAAYPRRARERCRLRPMAPRGVR